MEAIVQGTHTVTGPRSHPTWDGLSKPEPRAFAAPPWAAQVVQGEAARLQAGFSVINSFVDINTV